MTKRLLVGAFGLLLLAGCSDDGSSDDAQPASTTSAPAETAADDEVTTTTTTTTTTTIAPEDVEPLDEEALDIDREFSSDSEAESLGPIGTTETTIPTDEGEVSIGGGDIPDLAAEVPVPPGFEVQLTTEVEGEAGYSGRVDGELADLIAFYEAALPEAGFEIVERQSVPGVLEVFSVEGPLVGDIVISEEPGGAGWSILAGLAEPGA
ncbi:MAG: hypothetical protein AAGE98_00295 [Actinomycetota bacterium]